MTDLRLAAPRTPDPMEAPAIRWGVLGPGKIARFFANSVVGATRSTFTAVGSRSLERAEAFCAELGTGRAHGSYEELVADPEVADDAVLALEAGKPVLVEKAFTRNAD